MLLRFFGLPTFFSLPGASMREPRLHAGVISAGSCKQEEPRLHAGVGTKVACRSNFSKALFTSQIFGPKSKKNCNSAFWK